MPRLAGSAVLALVLALLLAGNADARSYFRAEATANTGGSASSLTINVPTGTVSGDVMVAVLSSNSATPPTAPGGWTKINGASTTVTNPSNGSVTWWYRVAGSSEPASYQWTFSSNRVAGGIASYVGVSNASPVDVSNVTSGSGTSSFAAPAVTTTAANELVVSGVGERYTSSTTITPPGTVTNRGSAQTTSSSFVGFDNADFNQASASSTGTKTYNFSNSTTWAIGSTIALKAAAGVLAFGVAPALPTLTGVTLNGQSQNVLTTMTNFDVDDTTASGSGWNVTVNGDASAGNKAVFTRYCPNATCGSDSGPGYVAGGASLPAGSLTLTSTGASMTGGSGTAPTLQCGSGCSVDSASATKIASAAAAAGAGPWQTTGFGSSSLKLVAPTTLRTLPASEVYRVNVIWTLNSGP